MSASRVCDVLLSEHKATIELFERLLAVLGKYRDAPPGGDAAVERLMKDLPFAIEAELFRHFEFEEQKLFPLLDDLGESELGEHLTDEHEVMLPLLRELVRLSKEAQSSGFDAARWLAFRRVSEQLAPLLLEHAKKEDLMLVPLLQEQLDAQADLTLHTEYAG